MVRAEPEGIKRFAMGLNTACWPGKGTRITPLESMDKQHILNAKRMLEAGRHGVLAKSPAIQKRWIDLFHQELNKRLEEETK
ncbi:hypothetical protein TW86_03695 [Halomonas sp. S2151]|nr:hypothetical protein TW86_03695 [Halomonas sp. S2151]